MLPLGAESAHKVLTEIPKAFAASRGLRAIKLFDGIVLAGSSRVMAHEVRATTYVETLSEIVLNGRHCARKRHEKKHYAAKRIFPSVHSVEVNT